MAPAITTSSSSSWGGQALSRTGRSTFASTSAFTLQHGKRQSLSSQWSTQDQIELAKVVDDDGNFNGTCISERSGLPPQVGGGQCASYYPNVTTYCCAAVGGSLVQTQQTGGDSNGDGSMSANETSVEPACSTSDYDNMLLCYMYTAEEHCRSAVSGPWGICNTAAGAGNQTAASSSSSAEMSSSVQGSFGVGQANASTRQPSMKASTLVAAIALSSILLNLVSDTI
jgi:hypothetical protein